MKVSGERSCFHRFPGGGTLFVRCFTCGQESLQSCGRREGDKIRAALDGLTRKVGCRRKAEKNVWTNQACGGGKSMEGSRPGKTSKEVIHGRKSTESIVRRAYQKWEGRVKAHCGQGREEWRPFQWNR